MVGGERGWRLHKKWSGDEDDFYEEWDVTKTNHHQGHG
jgi:hypothetical protein